MRKAGTPAFDPLQHLLDYLLVYLVDKSVVRHAGGSQARRVDFV